MQLLTAPKMRNRPNLLKVWLKSHSWNCLLFIVVNVIIIKIKVFIIIIIAGNTAWTLCHHYQSNFLVEWNFQTSFQNLQTRTASMRESLPRKEKIYSSISTGKLEIFLHFFGNISPLQYLQYLYCSISSGKLTIFLRCFGNISLLCNPELELHWHWHWYCSLSSGVSKLISSIIFRELISKTIWKK